LEQNEAKKEGFDPVLGLDGIHRRLIQEVGILNVFFAFKDGIVTSPCLGSLSLGSQGIPALPSSRTRGTTRMGDL
jgi:branched-chain amino acid aminotransferase